MFPSKKMGKYELSVLILCLILLAVLIFFEMEFSCLTTKYPLTFAILANIFSGIIAAITLLFLLERHYLRQLNKYYSKIEGQYTRISIGQDNTGEIETQSMRKQNEGLSITMSHNKGENSFKISAEYWRDDNALVEGFIEFNDKNGTSAYGRYRYINEGAMHGDSGTYRIYRLEEDKTKLLVLFHHLFPRRLENNPDSNRGWEIWQKNSR